jgi:hypothetical protein
MITQGHCRFCGARVVVDSEKRTVNHEAPACDRFDEMCKAAGGERQLGVTYRDGDGREIKVGQA